MYGDRNRVSNCSRKRWRGNGMKGLSAVMEGFLHLDCVILHQSFVKNHLSESLKWMHFML